MYIMTLQFPLINYQCLCLFNYPFSDRPNLVGSLNFVSAALASIFTYHFSVDGNPIPTPANFQLAKAGAVQYGSRYTFSSSSLMISNMQYADTGTYTISVSTVSGSDSISFYLSVYCKYIDIYHLCNIDSESVLCT